MNATALIADGPAAPKLRPPNTTLGLRRYNFGFPRSFASCDEAEQPRSAVVVPFGSPNLSQTKARSANVDDAKAFAGLVERIALHADREAFAQVFAHYGPRVKGYLLRLGMDSAQAEELSQDVMVAVWRKAATFDRRQASVSTWIFRIARNRRIDVFRHDRRAQLDIHDPAFQPPAEAQPDAVAEAGEQEAQVRRAMAELPQEQRDLIRKAFYEDLSHSQIAEKTGVPLGTVKSRLRLAMAKLKLRLEVDIQRGEG
jgi:RNA polymerase sigma factor (sigma-70 family)